ncbi:MAG: HAD-IA family hydrolase [Alphaproteobacteria bacterium]|nr:HAD-IA family hydrolase [Alphaproteobacteria bacterium]
MVQASPTHLIVFDCDGTLVDSQHVIVEAMNAAFRAHALDAPDAVATRRTVGLHLGEAITRLLPDGAEDHLEDVAASYKEVSFALRNAPDHEEPLYPGVYDVLQSLLGQQFQLGVATGKSRRGLVATLERHGLRDHFVTLKTSDDGPGKPNPDILNDAMAETGASPESTIMIGDTTFDITMAVRARAQSIGVAWGYHAPEELTAVGASQIAETFTDLPAVIAGLWGITP